MKIQKLFLILSFFFLICDSLAFNIKDKQFDIEADNIWVDVKKQLITAEGNVTITTGGAVLTADKAVYNKQTQQLVVVGNINIDSGKKYSFVGQRAFFDQGKKKGNIIQFAARLEQKTFLTSKRTEMFGETSFMAKEIVFTTCAICKNNLIANKPLWQVNADEVNVNLEDESMSLKKSKVRFLNVPFLYIPRLNLPIPGSSRRSGFLFPIFKHSNVFGVQANIKYYFNLRPNMDLTYSPIFSTKENILHNFHYRYLTRYGQYSLGGYLVGSRAKENDLAGRRKKWNSYIYSNGEFDYGNDVFMNYQLKSVLNGGKLFLENYNISDEDVMNSHINFFQTADDYFYSLQFLYFQDIRKNDQKDETNFNQFVFPWIWTANKLPYKVPFFDEVLFSTNFYNLNNTDSDENHYMNFQLEGIRSIITDSGLKMDIMPSIRLYRTMKVHNKKNTHASSELFVNTMLPFIKRFHGNNIILEPFVNITLIPKKYEEDFADDNQMSGVNMSGITGANMPFNQGAINMGSNLNYGMRANYSVGDNIFGAVLAQHYNFHQAINKNKHDSYSWNNILLNKKTAMLGKIYAQFADDLVLVNNATINSDNMSIIKNEIDSSLSLGKVKMNLNHIIINKKYLNKEYNLYNQEIGLGVSLNFYQDWWVNLIGRRKLGDLIQDVNNDPPKDTQKWVGNEFSFLYEGDCLKVKFGVKRNYLKPVRDKKTVTSFLQIEPLLN